MVANPRFLQTGAPTKSTIIPVTLNTSETQSLNILHPKHNKQGPSRPPSVGGWRLSLSPSMVTGLPSPSQHNHGCGSAHNGVPVLKGILLATSTGCFINPMSLSRASQRLPNRKNSRGLSKPPTLFHQRFARTNLRASYGTPLRGCFSISA